jgi:hypothetical protein
MWAAWVTGPATDDRRPARVPLDQPFPRKRRVRACLELERGARQIVYKQWMRGDCSASEECMSLVSGINSRRTRPLRPRPPASGSQATFPSPDRDGHYRSEWRNELPHALLPVERPLYPRLAVEALCLDVVGSLVTFLLSSSLGVMC